MSAKLDNVFAMPSYDAITKKHWRYKETTTPLRRRLLNDGDKLVFSQAGSKSSANLELQVCDCEDKVVLGGSIRLTREEGTNPPQFTTTSYGRLMTFTLVHDDLLVYTAIYEGEPHRHPDEGGEADPW